MYCRPPSSACSSEWCRTGEALAIFEELGNHFGIAQTYLQLGREAQGRGVLDKAERWYRHSLSIFEEVGIRPGMATSYGQLGLLAEARGDLSAALEWMVRCVTLFEAFPHPTTGSGPWHLARLTGRLGLPALEAAWRKVTGQALPASVRAWVEAHRDDPR